MKLYFIHALAFTATTDMDDIQLPYVFQINVTDTSFIPINTSDSATVRPLGNFFILKFSFALFVTLIPQWQSHVLNA